MSTSTIGKTVGEAPDGKKFAKGSDGFWAKPGGEAWPSTIIMLQGNPSGPVLVQQLKSAGFNVVFQALQSAAHNDAMAAGNFDLALDRPLRQRL